MPKSFMGFPGMLEPKLQILDLAVQARLRQTP